MDPNTAATMAIKLAREALADLDQAQLTGRPDPWFWVGRLRASLAYLADEAEAELNAQAGK